MLGTARLVYALGLDEPKVVPLAFGPSIVGAILVGFTHWGTPTGGFPDMGAAYAVGHAHVTPLMQLTGVIVTMVISGVPALVLCLLFEQTTGLRVSPDAELAGLDNAKWGVGNSGDDLAKPLGGESPSIA